MIRPKLQRVASGTRLTTDLVNAIINRTEYAADLLRQYKLIAGNQMYVEPHYDGTRVSYYYPVGGGATPKGAPITIPPSEIIIELQPGIVYSVSQSEVVIDKKFKIFMMTPIAYQQGILLTGGLWYVTDINGTQAAIFPGYIPPAQAQLISSFSPAPGSDSLGNPYWKGGTIQIV